MVRVYSEYEKLYRGADVYSDHHLIVQEIRKCKTKREPEMKYYVAKLVKDRNMTKYRQELHAKLSHWDFITSKFEEMQY